MTNFDNLRQEVISVINDVAKQEPLISSLTLAGSFPDGKGPKGFSDIDTIVILPELTQETFDHVHTLFKAALEPVLSQYGWKLYINSTLGPLKFNDDQTAVLHLMLYSAEGHREHVIKSPFTCFDWQRSPHWQTAQMAQVYPCFALQPHHFLSARRGARDYLADLDANQITYRKIEFNPAGDYTEVKLGKPMNNRDRHEFAYHIMRFLMLNFCKLVDRENVVLEGQDLLNRYSAVSGSDSSRFLEYYLKLASIKQDREFKNPLRDLDERLREFVDSFEEDFKNLFVHGATRHILCRHAPTSLNAAKGQEIRFQGHSDLSIDPNRAPTSHELQDSVANNDATLRVASHLKRTKETLDLLLGPSETVIDERFAEINYGEAEGLSVSEAKTHYPDIFAAWGRGEDPAFPGGETLASVRDRALEGLKDRCGPGKPSTIICTHNVVLRELIGHHMGVPPSQRFKLTIPHGVPFEFISTDHGLFLDLEQKIERELFQKFFTTAP